MRAKIALIKSVPYMLYTLSFSRPIKYLHTTPSNVETGCSFAEWFRFQINIETGGRGRKLKCTLPLNLFVGRQNILMFLIPLVKK